jgi:hypothetical protein
VYSRLWLFGACTADLIVVVAAAVVFLFIRPEKLADDGNVFIFSLV